MACSVFGMVSAVGCIALSLSLALSCSLFLSLSLSRLLSRRRCRATKGHPLSEPFVSQPNVDIAFSTGTCRQDGRLQGTTSSRASRGVWLDQDSS